jgi:pimeloyl-ACP methyl ester carboxylesterase
VYLERHINAFGRKEIMMKQKKIICIAVVISAVFSLGLMSANAKPVHTYGCTEFMNMPIPNTTITLTQDNPASATVPEHCEIIGAINQRIGVDGMSYAIGFHLRMPENWNKKFYFQGGGGSDGNLGDALGSGALSQGYAVVSTDAGHDNTMNSDPNAAGTAAFGVDPQARIDYGYNALDKVTVIAKQIVKLHYAEKPRYSYFVGCSNGGRQGMVASQRFPGHFDGIVAGDPGFNLPKAAIAEAWNEQALAPLATKLSTNGQPYLPDTFTDGDLALAANAILAACDKLDGLVDGVVDNYPACTNKKVYPQLSAIQCTGPKTAACLSAGQIEALKTIYAGPRNSRGKALYSDWQWDAGITGFLSLRLWSLGIPLAPGAPLINNSLNLTLGGGALPMIFTTPPAITPLTGLEKYIFEYNFDTDAPKIFKTSGIYKQSSMQFMSAASTDLSAFKRRGGKLIVYHGQSDGVFSPRDTTNWYNEMDENMRGSAQEFARLFLVPGMGHCGMGPGTTSFDAFSAVVRWVENGIAPDSIIATASFDAPWPGRTRPLCPYPEQTRYAGTGDINDAVNFVCEMPRHRHHRGFDRGFDDFVCHSWY